MFTVVDMVALRQSRGNDKAETKFADISVRSLMEFFSLDVQHTRQHKRTRKCEVGGSYVGTNWTHSCLGAIYGKVCSSKMETASTWARTRLDKVFINLLIILGSNDNIGWEAYVTTSRGREYSL